jgi:hypothetical protein
VVSITNIVITTVDPKEIMGRKMEVVMEEASQVDGELAVIDL